MKQENRDANTHKSQDMHIHILREDEICISPMLVFYNSAVSACLLHHNTVEYNAPNGTSFTQV